MRIMVTEDEVGLREGLADYFESNGYVVEQAEDGVDAWEKIKLNKPDLVITDIMMPRMDGFQLCKKIKKTDILSDIPVIMLTAKKSEVDVVIGLEIGADDYITKPFSTRELLARVKGALRRTLNYNQQNESTVRCEKLTLNIVNRQVKWETREMYLTNKEFEILYLLITNEGKIFSRDQILDSVWGVDYDGNVQVVDLHVKNLRKKLEAVIGKGYKEHIINVPKKGYKYVINDKYDRIG